MKKKRTREEATKGYYLKGVLFSIKDLIENYGGRTVELNDVEDVSEQVKLLVKQLDNYNKS